MSQPPAYDQGSATNRDLDPHHTLPAPYGSGATVTDPAHLLPAWSGQEQPKGSWLRKIIVLLIILGIIGFVWWRIHASNAETAATANKAAQAANRPTPVQVTPVVMKKGRPGTLLTILCSPDDADRFTQLLLRETSTLGVRIRQDRRACLDRAHTTVQTAYGPIRVKTGSLAGETLNANPEFEDCKSAAAAHSVPVKQVMQAAVAGYMGLER